jgi:hypothetical protein
MPRFHFSSSRDHHEEGLTARFWRESKEKETKKKRKRNKTSLAEAIAASHS